MPSFGELAGLVGGSERVLRHDSKALTLVLCAGDRDLPAPQACPAALYLGHAVGFLPASDEILPAYQPEFVVPAPGPGTGLADLGYRPAGSPKTVRLSHSGLAGNSAAVFRALGITAAERAPTTLGIWLARCANCSADQR